MNTQGSIKKSAAAEISYSSFSFRNQFRFVTHTESHLPFQKLIQVLLSHSLICWMSDKLGLFPQSAQTGKSISQFTFYFHHSTHLLLKLRTHPESEETPHLSLTLASSYKQEVSMTRLPFPDLPSVNSLCGQCFYPNEKILPFAALAKIGCRLPPYKFLPFH